MLNLHFLLNCGIIICTDLVCFQNTHLQQWGEQERRNFMVVICLLLVIILVVAFVALFAYKPLQDLFQTSKSEKLKAFVSTFFASLTFAWLAIFANRLCTMSQDNLWSNLVGLFLATVVITLVVMLAWWNTKKWLCQ